MMLLKLLNISYRCTNCLDGNNPVAIDGRFGRIRDHGRYGTVELKNLSISKGQHLTTACSDFGRSNGTVVRRQ